MIKYVRHMVKKRKKITEREQTIICISCRLITKKNYDCSIACQDSILKYVYSYLQKRFR